MVNPKLPKEQQIIEHLRHIGTTLSNISKNIGHEMGPMKVQKVGTIADHMKPEWDRQEEMNYLRESNNIAMMTARYAVWGLLITGVISIAQLGFSIWKHYELKDNLQEKTIVIQEKETPVETPQVVKDFAKVGN